MAKKRELSECVSLSIKLNDSNHCIENNLHDDNDTKDLPPCLIKLLYLPKFSNYFKSVVKLDLSNNKISELTESISSLEKLENLILDNNNIKQLPVGIKSLNDLKELSLCKNDLFSLPPNIEKLQKLQTINLSGNQLQNLPNSWTKMNTLTVLDISNNLFKEIPNCLREGMSNIKYLNVSGNPHMNINATICSNNLRNFYAKNIGQVTTKFPKWIFSGKFFEMEELDFENTQFACGTLPVSDRKIHVKKLNLQNCKMFDTAIEEILINISSLECLQIGNIDYFTRNTFQVFPENYIVEPCSLKTIDIRKTGLADVSKSIEVFLNLTEINLEENTLSWLPEEICNLKKLQILYISKNDLIMLPQNLGSMTSLKILEAAHNYISLIPLSISNLKNLEYLDLFDNELIEVPEEIGNLENLKALDVELNVFDTREIVMPIRYLEQRSQLRIDKLGRSVGSRINNEDPPSPIYSLISKDNFNFDSENESIEGDLQLINETAEKVERENWDIPEDFSDNFDPFNPPAVPPPKWETQWISFENRFNFCPADLHVPRIREVIAEARANGRCPLPLSIVEGQFDDAD